MKNKIYALITLSYIKGVIITMTTNTIPIDDLTNRQRKLVERAMEEAHKADQMYFKHGSVAVQNSTVIATGYNHPRNKIRGRYVCSFHAEVHVLSRILRARHQPHCKTYSCFEEPYGVQSQQPQAKGAVGVADKFTTRFTKMAQAA